MGFQIGRNLEEGLLKLVQDPSSMIILASSSGLGDRGPDFLGEAVSCYCVLAGLRCF